MLKLKKHRQKAIETADGQLMTVVQMIQDVEWASINVEVFKALKVGTNTLNKIHEEVSLDDIESLMEENNAAMEVL